jgi:hypothetical protein
MAEIVNQIPVRQTQDFNNIVYILRTLPTNYDIYRYSVYYDFYRYLILRPGYKVYVTSGIHSSAMDGPHFNITIWRGNTIVAGPLHVYVYNYAGWWYLDQNYGITD